MLKLLKTNFEIIVINIFKKIEDRIENFGWELRFM